MARIAGVNIPTAKKVGIALTYIYGIGPHRSKQICEKANINESVRVSALSDDEVRRIRETIDSSYSVEGDLRMEVSLNVKNLICK